jgi:hypothetical protein
VKKIISANGYVQSSIAATGIFLHTIIIESVICKNNKAMERTRKV